MNKTAVTMPSVTHAIRARRAMSNAGYYSEIKKSPKVSDGGCTHILIVNGDPGDVIAILKRSRIKYGKLLNNTGY